MAVLDVAPLDAPVFTRRRSRLPVSVSAAVGIAILAMLIVMWVWGAVAPPYNPLATDPASARYRTLSHTPLLQPLTSA